MATDSTGRGVVRIAQILNCFSVEEPVHNLTAISNRLKLPKSTTHRLLTTLVNQGFLMRDVHERGYQLGYQLLYWGMVAQAALDLRTEALPILRLLSRSVGETAILTVRDGMRGLYLEIVESGQPCVPCRWDSGSGCTRVLPRRYCSPFCRRLTSSRSRTPSSCCHLPRTRSQIRRCCALNSPLSDSVATRLPLRKLIWARWVLRRRFTTARGSR